MNSIVTLEQLLNVSSTMMDNAKQHNEFNQLLDEFICNQYDVIENKKKIQSLFSKFKSAKYLYDFPVEESIEINPSYDLCKGSVQKSNKSQIERAVERYIDQQLFTTDIYNSLMKVSYKLTNDEVVYLINTFLTHKSEEDIADIIGISKTYLQKIKKSCIVKMWVELKRYC